MGFGGISPLSLLLILAIVILLFGTKKLRNIGGDIGGAIKNFKKSVKDSEAKESAKRVDDTGGRVIDAEAKIEEKDSA
ncbi:MAG: twin-arginine translocase TatA/TatE family subunit [Gammaproteobacteria bacterium]